jgi:hypothetical protein
MAALALEICSYVRRTNLNVTFSVLNAPKTLKTLLQLLSLYNKDYSNNNCNFFSSPPSEKSNIHPHSSSYIRIDITWVSGKGCASLGIIDC